VAASPLSRAISSAIDFDLPPSAGRLGRMLMTSVQNSHFTLPLSSGTVALPRPQFLHFHFHLGSLPFALDIRVSFPESVRVREAQVCALHVLAEGRRRAVTYRLT
jgi:hypothetical protein